MKRPLALEFPDGTGAVAAEEKPRFQCKDSLGGNLFDGFSKSRPRQPVSMPGGDNLDLDGASLRSAGSKIQDVTPRAAS